ncbi:hypothetical protein PHYBLDRAFT_152278 [Phycomyces blakesleeanus NRRL 1555(-)]|uniref:Uncharacterized protein n=1 Tax=Phycomyces blakesleeanus (strain ATCC 8743b / DSM 1359 / FGSC 10004 / NBRC 33097 / NRRL 1555) TaxID=763407 RepID=A0A167JUI3_PHYB8|nr:hypothetical protein PHYBLDRAFT_152278 [Phycomyces blakesleeanus NRRL 1555(-)]OAD66730.1 hypothetical protein PHYBLDRAFT_152278 [Phycomyces blakesleeanus NRRL 1555(-)]|eukprot:XP_018284770.1 hypothetical protein PHYBLDRAFT_152278 [Phycomyces blakesleeanus NRRL 1555(-)]
MNTQFPRFYPSGNPVVDAQMRAAQAQTTQNVQESRPENTKKTILQLYDFAQIQSESSGLKETMQQLFTDLRDITFGRAPLNINLLVSGGPGFQTPIFIMNSEANTGGSGSVQAIQFTNTPPQPTQPQQHQQQTTAYLPANKKHQKT